MIDLTQIQRTAQFTAHNLRVVLKYASPLEAHCLMPLIAQAQELANDLAALQFAINAKE